MCVAHVHKHTHNICGGCMEVYSSNVQIMQKPQWRELQFSLLFEKACLLSFVTHSVFLYGRFIYLIVDLDDHQGLGETLKTYTSGFISDFHSSASLENQFTYICHLSFLCG